jgi:hypothetical protein
VECEDISLEQGLANLFGDRLESKYSGFATQEDMLKSKVYRRPRKQHLHKSIYCQTYVLQNTVVHYQILGELVRSMNFFRQNCA